MRTSAAKAVKRAANYGMAKPVSFVSNVRHTSNRDSVSNRSGSTNMWRTLLVIFLINCSFVPASGQTKKSRGCSVESEFDPFLVTNPNSEVTFECDHATALQLIEATGRQSRNPLGIILGEDPTLLSKIQRTYRLEKVDTKAALLEAIAGTGYSLKEEDNVFVLVAGDLTFRQRQLLSHEFSEFRSGSGETMVKLGTELTMWIKTEIDHEDGFGGSILSSTNDERFTLGAIPASTTEELANRIVSLGSKGMWVLTMDAFERDEERTDGVEIKPYQHYSNLPNHEHAGSNHIDE
jgi:hypothetical protein